jgi:subtilisin family serine protease
MTQTSSKKIFLAFLTVLIAISGIDVSQAVDTSGVKEKYIVRFADDDDVQQESDDFKRKGMKVERTISRAFKGVVGEFSTAELSEIKKNPKVLYVEKDGIVQTTAFSSTPITVNPVPSWGLDRVNQRNLPLDNAYSYQYDGQGVKAYVIDTGINSTHTEFTGRILPGNSQIADGRGTEDCNGHGTHVAGTIGGTSYGVARNVSLVPVRVLDCAGSGSFSGVIAGIDWVIADHQAGQPAVANLSLGGGLSAAVNDAIARLIADGVVVVVAAGNSNANACNFSPSSAPNAITVGATERTDRRATYSNFGTCLDIFAPGSAILSSWIGSTTATSTISGTSMASPHVAGNAALLLEKTPGATPAQIRTSLVAGATPAKVTSAGTGSTTILLATETAAFVPTPVAQAPLTISNSVLEANVGTPITLTATGGSGSGALTFSVTGAGCSITNVTSLNASAAASCLVTANKAASTGFLSASSTPVTFSFVVPTPVAQAPLTITNSALSGTAGTSITLTASGGSGTGALSFSVTGAGCSITNTTSLNASAAASCSVTATKAASIGFLVASSSPVTFTFGPAPIATAPATPTVTSISSPRTRNLAVSVSTSNNGGAAIQQFVLSVWRSATINGTLVLDRTVTINTSALTASTTITGLTSRSFYAVSVVASNSVGRSTSSAVSARVQVR